jgi:trigger factor
VQARDRVLDALLAATEVPLPSGVVDAEIEVRKHDAVHAFDHDNDRLTEWLQSRGQSMEQFDAEVRADAERSVKAQLVLDAVAEREKIQVSEAELTDRIVYQAQRYGVSPEEYLRRAQEAGQLGAIFAEVRRGKAVAAVLRGAQVSDSAGNDVDIEELFAADSSGTAAEEDGDESDLELDEDGETGAASRSE